MRGLIYRVTNRINGKVYIGQTRRTLEKRKLEHSRSIQKDSLLPFHCAIRKYGEENFLWYKLMDCDTKEELDYFEKFYVKEFSSISPNGYNLTDGGESNPMDYEEIAKRMRKSWKENYRKERHAFFGKKRPGHSEWMKKNNPMKNPIAVEKMKKKRKNQIPPMAGKHHSEETIEKLRIMNIGKNNPHYKDGKYAKNPKTR